MPTFYKNSVTSILVLYWIALAWQAWHVGLTFDEPPVSGPPGMAGGPTLRLEPGSTRSLFS